MLKYPLLLGGLAVGGVTFVSLGGLHLHFHGPGERPTAPAQSLPYSGSRGTPISNSTEATFRADCAAHQGTVYTAAEWNAISPGANLSAGQMHCHRPATITVKQQ
jgi:hypothetical protein